MAPRQQLGHRIKILVVDDHRLFADVLVRRLEQESMVESALPAYGLDEARVLARRWEPDVVLLDYHVHDEVATSLIPDLRALPSAPQVVMLSASEDPPAIIDSLHHGAAAWVVKGSRLDVLMNAAQEVLDGNMYLSPTTVRPVVEELLDRNKVREPTFVDSLSERQLDVLRCLVAGMTRAETAARLFITPNTVRTHVQHLLKAADAHSTLALVARARQLGVVGIDDEDAARARGSSS